MRPQARARHTFCQEGRTEGGRTGGRGEKQPWGKSAGAERPHTHPTARYSPARPPLAPTRARGGGSGPGSARPGPRAGAGWPPGSSRGSLVGEGRRELAEVRLRRNPEPRSQRQSRRCVQTRPRRRTTVGGGGARGPRENEDDERLVRVYLSSLISFPSC